MPIKIPKGSGARGFRHRRDKLRVSQGIIPQEGWFKWNIMYPVRQRVIELRNDAADQLAFQDRIMAGWLHRIRVLGIHRSIGEMIQHNWQHLFVEMKMNNDTWNKMRSIRWIGKVAGSPQPELVKQSQIEKLLGRPPLERILYPHIGIIDELNHTRTKIKYEKFELEEAKPFINIGLESRGSTGWSSDATGT